MDWLPRPNVVDHPLPDVVCLSKDEDYDHQDWATYPQRQRWKDRVVSAWIAFFQAPPADFLPFLERWLFWAPLEQILNVGDLSAIEHVADIDGRACITVKAALDQLISIHTLRPNLEGYGMHKAFYIQYNPVQLKELPHSWKHLSLSEFCITHPYLFSDPRSQPLVWATELLHDISTTTFQQCNNSGGGGLGRGSVKWLYQDCSKIGIRQPDELCQQSFDRFRSTNWCPWDVAVLSRKYSPTLCFYISQFGRPTPWREHLTEANSSNTSHEHEARESDVPQNLICTTQRCVFARIDNETYTTAHAPGCSGCDELSVSRHELSDLLKAEQIPLTSLEQNSDGALQLSLYSHSGIGRKRPYIAFSHVWADGLGNLRDNAIPGCQAKSLQDLVDKRKFVRRFRRRRHATAIVPRRTREREEKLEAEAQSRWEARDDWPEHYWLDTLSVPPDALEDSQHQQKLAIHKMRETYEQAEAVVVLDAWLRCCSATVTSPLETLSRIITSPWTRRLWTLQEGVLPKTLLFAFEDSLEDADVVAKELRRLFEPGVPLWLTDEGPFELQPWYYQALGAEVQCQYYNLRRKEAETLASKAGLGYYNSLSMTGIRAALQFRSTSVDSNEALCLSVLTNISVKTLCHVKASNRMMRYWLLLQSVDVKMLLWIFQRLDEENFRWAPSTLLHNPISLRQLDTIAPVIKDRYGWKTAQVTKHGLVVHAKAIILRLEHKIRANYAFRVEFSNMKAVVIRHSWLPTDEAPRGEKLEPFMLRHRRDYNLAILFFREGKLSYSKISTGVLVGLLDRNTIANRVQYLEPVTVHVENNNWVPTDPKVNWWGKQALFTVHGVTRKRKGGYRQFDDDSDHDEVYQIPDRKSSRIIQGEIIEKWLVR